MLKILYVFGAQDTTIAVDPTLITGDWAVDRVNATLVSFVAGKMIRQNSSGYAVLADGSAGTKGAEGIIINSFIGNDFENWPGLASQKIPIVCGGIVETDQVVDNNIVPGELLYCGTGATVGKLTHTDPGAGVAVGIARTANSASDLTVRVRLFL